MFYFLERAVRIYSLLIWIRLLLKWIRMPALTADGEDGLYGFLCRVTDPFLAFFRRPFLLRGGIDWSPLIALMCLNILRTVFAFAGDTGKLTVALVLASVIQNLWSYIFNYILIILLILLAVRWFSGRRTADFQSPFLNNLDRNLNAPVSIVFRLFFTGKNPSDQTLVGVSFVFYLVVYLVLKSLFRGLCVLLLSL